MKRYFAMFMIVLMIVGFIPGQLVLATSDDGIVFYNYSSLPYLNSVAYGEGTYVAVGSQGAITTSSDGLTWETQPLITVEELYSVEYLNGNFVVVGDHGTIITSSDGQDWTLQVSPSIESLNKSAFDFEQYIIVGQNGTILTSDDLVDWTEIVTDFEDDLFNIYYNENHNYVIVGEVDDYYYYYGALFSGDNLSDLSRTYIIDELGEDDGDEYNETYFSSIIHNDDKLIAVGVRYEYDYYYDDYLDYSIVATLGDNDDDEWSEIDTVGLGFVPRSVIFSNGVYLVVGRYGGIATSTDLTNWTEVSYAHVNDYGNQLNDVSTNETSIVAVGRDGTIITGFYDDETPIVSSQFQPFSLYDIAIGQDTDVMVGESGTIMSSNNDWHKVLSGTSNSLHAVTYGDDTFVAVGHKPEGDGVTILVSENGDEWSSRTSNSPETLRGIAYGASRFVAVGGETVALSTDSGENWVSTSNELSKDLQAVSFGSNTFMAVGYDNAIVISSDGTDWTEVGFEPTPPTSFNFRAITYINDAFIAVGDDGAIVKLTSEDDGITWTASDKTSNNVNSNLYGISYTNGAYVAVGNQGNTAISTDNADTWIAGYIDSEEDFYDVIGENGFFLAVGSRENIWVSNNIPEAPTYSVTYVATDVEGHSRTGNPPLDYMAYTEGNQVTVMDSNDLEMDGLHFAGWNTMVDGSGITYAPNATFDMGSEGVTLYSLWSDEGAPTYNIIYIGNGNETGNAPIDSFNYVMDTDIIIPIYGIGDLGKSSNTFAGWNTTLDGSGTSYSANTSISMNSTSNLNLYAMWTPNVVSSLKALTSFGFNTPAVTGTVNEVAKTVSITVPFGTALTSLAANFTTTTGTSVKVGETVQVSGVTTNDFSHAVIYRVTAEDNSYVDYTVTVRVASPYTPPSEPAKEIITADVEDAGTSVITKVPIERTSLQDGTKRDVVLFTEDLAAQTVETALAAASKSASIVLPDAKDEVSEIRVTVPKEAYPRLADADVDLGIHTRDVKLTIPSTSLQDFNDEIYFNFIPLKSEQEKQEVETRASKEAVVTIVAGDNLVTVIGRPMTIETNMQGRPVTLVMPLNDATLTQEELDNLGIYIEHSDGTKELIRGTVVPFNESGELGLQFTINKFSTFTLVHIDGSALTTHTAYMKGYQDGTFRPDSSITRAEMAAILSRVIDRPATAPARSYNDISATHWAHAYIADATQMGLMRGFTDGSFAPNQVLTRAEMAVLIANIIGVSKTEDAAGYSDVAGHWAADAIAQAQAAGYLSVFTGDLFEPKRQLTRAETVVIMNKLLGRTADASQGDAGWRDVPLTYWAAFDIAEASIDHTAESLADGTERWMTQ